MRILGFCLIAVGAFIAFAATISLRPDMFPIYAGVAIGVVGGVLMWIDERGDHGEAHRLVHYVSRRRRRGLRLFG